jgi:hypothetical protein
MATAKTRASETVEQDDEKSNATSAILLLVAVILVAGFAVQYGLQTLVWLGSKSWATANPWITDVPAILPAPAAPTATPAPANSSSKSSAKKAAAPAQVRLYNYEFLPPWPGTNNMRPGQSYSEVRFGSGQVIVVFDPATQVKTISDMRTQNTPDYQRMEAIFGDQTPGSDFAFYKLAYDAAPAQVSPFMQRIEAERVNSAMLYKLGFGYEMQSGLHSFEFGNNHGFEFGDAAKGGPVVLRLFDDRDNQFRMIFTVAAGSNAKITQDDIDVVAQSFQPIPLLER